MKSDDDYEKYAAVFESEDKDWGEPEISPLGYVIFDVLGGEDYDPDSEEQRERIRSVIEGFKRTNG